MLCSSQELCLIKVPRNQEPGRGSCWHGRGSRCHVQGPWVAVAAVTVAVARLPVVGSHGSRRGGQAVASSADWLSFGRHLAGSWLPLAAPWLPACLPVPKPWPPAFSANPQATSNPVSGSVSLLQQACFLFLVIRSLDGYAFPPLVLQTSGQSQLQSSPITPGMSLLVSSWRLQIPSLPRLEHVARCLWPGFYLWTLQSW